MYAKKIDCEIEHGLHNTKWGVRSSQHEEGGKHPRKKGSAEDDDSRKSRQGACFFIVDGRGQAVKQNKVK